MVEQVCIKWNDFQESTVSSYKNLRKNLDFSDVTLVCEDAQQIEAHKVILSACSPFFRSILKSSKHDHPMIYMKGVKAKDMVAIVDFVYHGEAEVPQEDLDGVLDLANSLKLTGFSGSESEVIMTKEELIPEDGYQGLEYITKIDKVRVLSNAINPTQMEDVDCKNLNGIFIDPLECIEKKTDSTYTDLERKGDETDFMTETINNEEILTKCKVCGKENKGKQARTNMRKHLRNHSDGVFYTCNQCGKVIKSWTNLNTHILIDHKE